MFNLNGLGCIVLATTTVATVTAETHCPGNVASVSYHLVNRYEMVVEVSINHRGPYGFLLDTGTQMTMVDRSVADDLHLGSQGTVVVAGAGSRQSASSVQVDLLQAGSQAVPNQRVLVFDLHNLHIQGILGEDFLEHFDMLIDSGHKLLCLDSSGALQANVRGPHAALVARSERADGDQLSSLIIVKARLSDATRPVHLMLDSGANGAVLYNTAEYLETPRRGSIQGTSVDGRQRMFSALPLQDVRIDSLRLTGVPFFRLSGNEKDARAKGFDGILTLGLFRRVFIAHEERFAVLEPM